MFNGLVVATLALLAASAEATMYCFEAPSIDNSVCYKNNSVLTPDQMLGTFQVGDVVMYQCLNGYVLHGSASVTCQATGYWTKIPTCAATTTTSTTTTTTRTTTPRPTCQGLPVLNNGTCTGAYGISGVYQIGNRSSCSCSPGYNLVGGSSVVCQSSGTWSSLPTCAVVMCYAPPSISNSQCYRDTSVLTPSQISSMFFYYGDVITYQCLSGYGLSGNTSIQCQSNGAWSKQPSCVEVCTSLPNVANGVCNGTSSTNGTYFPNTAVPCTCNTGYKIGSVTSAKCGSNGSWSTVPTCTVIPTCKGVPTLTNGNCTISNDDGSGIYAIGSQASCSCNVGYQFPASPTTTSTCSSAGAWGKVSSCSQIPVCNTLPTLADGVCSGTVPAAVGGIATCVCQDGYEVGTNTGITTFNVSCKAMNSWTTLSKCTAIKTTTLRTTTVVIPCPAPPQIPGSGCDNCNVPAGNASAVTTTFPYGAEIRYQCQNGYNLIGNAVITCQKNGTWTPLPICELKTTTVPPTCPRPPVVNGTGCSNCGDTSNSIVFHVGDEMRYQCRSGYTLEGNSVITCQSDGTWSTPPTCVPSLVTTTEPTNSLNGARTTKTTTKKATTKKHGNRK